MKFLDFLNDVDWGKNIIFLIIYMLITMSSVLFYLMPIIDNHKIQTINYKKTQNLDQTINENISLIKNNMQSMLKNNQKIYDNMRNKINMEELKQYIDNYLSNATIIDEGMSAENNDIQINKINIIGNAKNTKDIMNLIEKLENLNNSIRIGFPINITKQNNILKVEISIKVYYSFYVLDS